MILFAKILLGIIGVLIVVAALFIAYVYQYCPKWQELIGQYKYIGVSYHRVPLSCRFKLVYPAQPTESDNPSIQTKYQRAKYFFEDETPRGLSIFSKLPSFLYGLLVRGPQNPPLFEHPPLLKKEDGSQYPLIIFAHGMGGNWDMYTQLMADLASSGFIVAVIDFVDGSASHSRLPDGSLRYFERPSKKSIRSWTEDETVQLRGPYLRERKKQMIALYRYLRNLDIDNITSSDKNSEKMKEIRPQIDFNQVVLAGHSFGAGAAMLSYYDLQEEISCVILHDGWYGAATKEDWSEKVSVPCLHLFSEQWTGIIRSNWERVRILCESNEVMNEDKPVQYVNGTGHIDFCDSTLWAPLWLTKIFGSKGSQDVADKVGVISQRTVNFIARRLNGMEDSCKPFAKNMLVDYSIPS